MTFYRLRAKTYIDDQVEFDKFQLVESLHTKRPYTIRYTDHVLPTVDVTIPAGLIM